MRNASEPPPTSVHAGGLDAEASLGDVITGTRPQIRRRVVVHLAALQVGVAVALEALDGFGWAEVKRENEMKSPLVADNR